MKVTGCIPSRYASTQLPGKPLCDIGGKPMVVRVVEQAMQARSLDSVIVLTDDERILDTVKNAGYQAAMTSEHCASGRIKYQNGSYSFVHLWILFNRITPKLCGVNEAQRSERPNERLVMRQLR